MTTDRMDDDGAPPPDPGIDPEFDAFIAMEEGAGDADESTPIEEARPARCAKMFEGVMPIFTRVLDETDTNHLEVLIALANLYLCVAQHRLDTCSLDTFDVFRELTLHPVGVISGMLAGHMPTIDQVIAAPVDPVTH